MGNLLAIGLGAAGAAVDAIGQNQREKRAVKNQMALNQQSKDLALQQWKDTNYAAQREEMEKAGLNVGMMYGMGGGGGTTASTGSGGSAPSPQKMPMDMAGMMQLGLLKAQKENIEADTANKKAGAGNAIAGTAKTEEETKATKFNNEINASYEEQIREAKGWNLSKEVISGEEANAAWEMKKAIDYNQEGNTKEQGGDFTSPDTRLAKQRIAELRQATLTNDSQEAKNVISNFEADLAKRGIHPNSPWYAKLLTSLLEKAGIVEKIESGLKTVNKIIK